MRPITINMTNFSGMYDIRDMAPEDKNFILATFLRGLYYGDSWWSTIPKQIFMDNYKKVAEQLIDNTKTEVKVACLKDEPNVILGYSILSKDYLTIHWVFVKSPWRKRGIARSLLPQYPAEITHLTATGKSLMSSKFPTAIFNPFKI